MNPKTQTEEKTKEKTEAKKAGTQTR
jgi:hypothetical protein